jgi:hypothetical protein
LCICENRRCAIIYRQSNSYRSCSASIIAVFTPETGLVTISLYTVQVIQSNIWNRLFWDNCMWEVDVILWTDVMMLSIQYYTSTIICFLRKYIKYCINLRKAISAEDEVGVTFYRSVLTFIFKAYLFRVFHWIKLGLLKRIDFWEENTYRSGRTISSANSLWPVRTTSFTAMESCKRLDSCKDLA